jgi:DNA-binding PadR family transcriptional regulator
MERALTDFEHILLGMLVEQPRSGYDLKKLFSATPAAVYQSGPGALYPALRRLTARGLLRIEADPSPGRRGRRVYYPTQAGLAEHLDWVRQPVDPATIAHELGLHLMRFVMMEHRLPADDIISFMKSLVSALESFVAGMESFAASPDAKGLPGRFPLMAIDHGIAVHRASLDWARLTMARLSEPARGAQLR